jgi:hypothetical protein
LREVKEKGATVRVHPAAHVVGDKADKTTTLAINDNLSLEDEIVKRVFAKIFEKRQREINALKDEAKNNPTKALMKLFNASPQDFFLLPNGEPSYKTILLTERLLTTFKKRVQP